MATPKFEIVENEADEPQGTSVLLLALKALSQRALAAAPALFAFPAVGSVFWVAISIMGNPNVYQLVGLGGYSCFILASIWLVRRK